MRVRRARKTVMLTSKSWGHTPKGWGKRMAGKARRRLGKALAKDGRALLRIVESDAWDALPVPF